ncbi:ATP-binding cassette domain-containing protein [Cellulomonas sp. P22]|uniref:ABC transporter ATP-binding protein/permease n=1 Tax=Cellulomonas sp. P22 TaxID=3373189 RepID=UPI0037B2044A
MADAAPLVVAVTAEPAMTPLVELRGIVRRYTNDTVALAGVDLKIVAGESVAVVGRSGSGKSTLLNVLGLLDAPSEGQVVIDGEPVRGASDSARSERRSRDLGFVFQRSHLIPALSVLENVMLGLRYAPVPQGAIRDTALDALAAVGLEHRTAAQARTLSGGEMQRVAIARTLARPARLWLADEPTGNLDSAQSVEIIELLKVRAAQRGAALVVVTHEPEIAARLDRVVTLSDGRLVHDTGSANLVGEPASGRGGTRDHTSWVRRMRRTARFITQAVTAHPARTRSGVAAATVAVALTVAALGLAQSAAAQVTGLFDARRATEVTAQMVSDDPDATRWPIRLDALGDFPGVAGVELWQHRTGIAIANGPLAAESVDLVQVAAAPGPTTDSAITWAAGGDDALNAGEILLGEALAERLGITQLDVSPEVTVEGVPLRVAGFLTASRSGTATGSAFVTEASALEPSASADLFVQTVPGAARNVADRLQVLVDPYQTMRMTIDPVLKADAYRGQLQDSVAASLQVLAVVASLAGLAAVVFVNILSVNTRTAEFGVRRAFGASRSELVALVMGEGAVLGFIGAGLGLAVGFIAVMAVTLTAHWQPVFDLRLLLVPLAGALVFGTLGGVPPAIAAGRIQPADAVRS